ncbi:hypothetical protein SAMN05444408_10441 [Chryseobacterium takakiae]|uniref:Uncharacterized protein n=1 Tax=Chryseobacterium takakiae TaxID=1302685 RepID=A0A1M4W7V6_9FLAO|nr:hypothetical protein SAMN05444408_10441 [Chryseobacterium takakiae]
MLFLFKASLYPIRTNPQTAIPNTQNQIGVGSMTIL